MGNCFCIDPLKQATFDNTPTYSLKGIRTRCKVVEVYDGDTLWIVISLHGSLYKYKIRMLGYDSPEMKPLLSQANRDLEIQAAVRAKEHLIGLLNGKEVVVEFMEYDKYGRPLAKLYTYVSGYGCIGSNDDVCINDQMVQDGHGKIVDGSYHLEKEQAMAS